MLVPGPIFYYENSVNTCSTLWFMLHLSSLKHTCTKLSMRVGDSPWLCVGKGGKIRWWKLTSSKCVCRCTMGFEKGVSYDPIGFENCCLHIRLKNTSKLLKCPSTVNCRIGLKPTAVNSRGKPRQLTTKILL